MKLRRTKKTVPFLGHPVHAELPYSNWLLSGCHYFNLVILVSVD